jgi:hypothetical protein
MRYRSAAMAEFMRSLRTLKALQAEQAAIVEPRVAGPALADAQPSRLRARSKIANSCVPNEPERHPELPAEHRLEYLLPDAPGPGSNLHEPAPSWMPNEPEPAAGRTGAGQGSGRAEIRVHKNRVAPFDPGDLRHAGIEATGKVGP